MRLALASFVALLAAAGLAAVVSQPGHARPAQQFHTVARPNVVFVLTDDLTWNLIPYMPNVQRMEREGMTFKNYFVTDSLCCPSRASIFTGRYPHNHGVLTNTAPTGGFSAFRRGDESRTFATAMHDAGYRTAMMGKYLNGYHPMGRYVPPGWSNWQVPGAAYSGFGYVMSTNGRTAHFGKRRRDYLTDVLRRRGKAFVSRVAEQRAPFMLEMATYAPHHPYTPAPRNRFDFPGLEAPRTAAFDAETAAAPDWLRGRPPLTPEEIAGLDTAFRKRAQSVEAVDDLVGQIREELRQTGLDQNTYVVFSSDNGFHMGEHRLTAGKMTAFDTDIRVPLIVVGPGVPAASSTDELTSNIDLAPTFMRLAGVTPPSTVDGSSLVGLMHGEIPTQWRNAVLVEHHRPPTPNGDPDRQAIEAGKPPTYDALRTHSGTYVEYVDGEREYYDLRSDPNELDNVYDRLSGTEQEDLHDWLASLRDCSGAACRAAAVR